MTESTVPSRPPAAVEAASIVRPTSLLVLALGLAAGAAFMSPDVLAGLGIMAESIRSKSELIRHTTILEITVLRCASALAALFLGVCYLSWRRIARTRIGIWLTTNTLGNVLSHGGIAWWTFGAMAALSALTFAYILFGGAVLRPAVCDVINREDGVVETLTAVAFFLASALSITALVRKRFAGRARRTTLIIFAALFFFCGAEEMSWGQRFIGFDTPASMEGMNVQKEFNLHNLMGYFVDHLAYVAIVGYCVGLPLLAGLSPFWRTLMGRAGLILPSWGLAVGFLVCAVFHKRMFWALFPHTTGIPVIEFRECIVGIGFVLLMIEYWRGSAGLAGIATQTAAKRDERERDDEGRAGHRDRQGRGP